jgi:hypothetical protein
MHGVIVFLAEKVFQAITILESSGVARKSGVACCTRAKVAEV